MCDSRKRLYILVFIILSSLGFVYGLSSRKAPAADFSESDFNRISPFNVRS